MHYCIVNLLSPKQTITMNQSQIQSTTKTIIKQVGTCICFLACCDVPLGQFPYTYVEIDGIHHYSVNVSGNVTKIDVAMFVRCFKIITRKY